MYSNLLEYSLVPRKELNDKYVIYLIYFFLLLHGTEYYYVYTISDYLFGNIVLECCDNNSLKYYYYCYKIFRIVHEVFHIEGRYVIHKIHIIFKENRINIIWVTYFIFILIGSNNLNITSLLFPIDLFWNMCLYNNHEIRILAELKLLLIEIWPY